jgi:hypothetical protein
MSIGNMSLNSNHALTKENFVANSEKRADRVQPSTTGVFSMAGSSCHGERNEKAAPEEDNLALVPDSVIVFIRRIEIQRIHVFIRRMQCAN